MYLYILALCVGLAYGSPLSASEGQELFIVSYAFNSDKCVSALQKAWKLDAASIQKMTDADKAHKYLHTMVELLVAHIHHLDLGPASVLAKDKEFVVVPKDDNSAYTTDLIYVKDGGVQKDTPLVKSVYLKSMNMAFLKTDSLHGFEARLAHAMKQLPCLGSVEFHATASPGLFPVSAREGVDYLGTLKLLPTDPGMSLQWPHEMMHVFTAWDMWYPARTQLPLIGIVDSGCDMHAPDIAHAFPKNPGEICDNGIDDDKNGYVDDCYGYDFLRRTSDISEANWHGTVTAHLIAAQANNSMGIAGYCPNCPLVCAKIGDSTFYEYAFVEAINYLASRGVKIVTFSGSGFQSAALDASMAFAEQQGMVVVAAAPNLHCDLDIPKCGRTAYPAVSNHSNVISVSSVDLDEMIPYYGAWGKTKLDVFGTSGVSAPTPSGGISQYFGSSYATSSVAALAALVWSRHPNMTHYQVADAIRRGGTVTKYLNGKSQGGRVDYAQTILMADLEIAQAQAAAQKA